MAHDINHSLPSDLQSEHPTAIFSDPTNDHHSDPHQPSLPTLTTFQKNIRQQPQYYPIFDPPKIKLQTLAQEKAAMMAQYDDLVYAVLAADDDSPFSDNIKASEAQFATLCDNELFPAVFNISESLLQSTFTSLTQLLSAYNPGHSVDTFSHDDQHSAKLASVVSPGIGQGNATFKFLFASMCQTNGPTAAYP